MRVLIVGGGGREHALAWKLAQEATVFVAPGNPGIATCAELVPIEQTDHEGLGAWAQSNEIDLVLCGPEDPLVNGLGNFLRDLGLTVYGPNRDGAQLEASKAYSKDLMREAGIPTAQFETFSDPNFAKEYAKHQWRRASMRSRRCSR